MKPQIATIGKFDEESITFVVNDISLRELIELFCIDIDLVKYSVCDLEGDRMDLSEKVKNRGNYILVANYRESLTGVECGEGMFRIYNNGEFVKNVKRKLISYKGDMVIKYNNQYYFI